MAVACCFVRKLLSLDVILKLGSSILFPHLTMQVKNAAGDTSVKPQTVLIHDSVTVPSMTTRTITALVNHSTEWKTTGTETPVGNFTEAASLIISHSIPTKMDKRQQPESPTKRNHFVQPGKTIKLPESL